MILDFNPTPIYINNRYDHRVQDEIKSALEHTHFSSFEMFDKNNTKLSGFPGGSYFLDDYNCNYTKSVILEEVNNYLNQIGSKPNINYGIANSWITSSNKGSYTQVHHHQSLGISGVYYFKTNTNDGDFFLRKDTKYVDMSEFFNTGGQDFHVTPEVGKIILFPSWLDHGVRMNDTDDTRISLSFNIEQIHV